MSAVLPLLEMPCLVLNREDDPFAPAEWGRELAGKIPNAQLVVTEGSDHLPWFGDGQPLVAAIADFLGEHEIAPDASRRLMTVMFTDIVDSTVKAVDLGDTAWTELLEKHNNIMREVLDRYRGEEVKTTGDGFLTIFDSSARAVECGHAAMHLLGGQGLSIRAGIHSGDVEILTDDVAGLTVHIASRITSLAGPGEVLVSDAVKALAVGAPIGFTDRGEHELKGVPGSWHLFSALQPEDEIVIDLRQPKELNTADQVSVFLARRAPVALRTLAGLASRTG